jgi:predicted RNase H-like HicB family nuclease
MGYEIVKYAVVIEKAADNYSAYVPDLPGCIATGGSVEETERNIHDAIRVHIQGMREDGESIPAATTHVAELEIA